MASWTGKLTFEGKDLDKLNTVIKISIKPWNFLVFVETASTLITKFLQSGHSVGRQVATADKAGADRK